MGHGCVLALSIIRMGAVNCLAASSPTYTCQFDCHDDNGLRFFLVEIQPGFVGISNKCMMILIWVMLYSSEDEMDVILSLSMLNSSIAELSLLVAAKIPQSSLDLVPVEQMVLFRKYQHARAIVQQHTIRRNNHPSHEPIHLICLLVCLFVNRKSPVQGLTFSEKHYGC